MSLEERRRALLETMDRLGLGALVVGLPGNFAWYTGGADNRIDQSQPPGVAAVLFTPEAEYVVADNIEAPRMREEETPGFEVVEHPWYESATPLYRELAGGASYGADFSLKEARDVSAEISPLRYVLDAEAVETYRLAGAEASAAMEEAAAFLSPGTTEHEAAAILVSACRRRGLTTPVTLAAADDRIALYRHPIPYGATIERRVMLVVSAERGGLHVSLTRIVDFEEPDAEVSRRQGACEEILHRMREEATQPGRTLADAFENCKRFYAEAGFPDEWRLHHQGGMTGYASRESIATPETLQEIQVGQAFAWNPSITGAKAEETFVLRENGPEVISG